MGLVRLLGKVLFIIHWLNYCYTVFSDDDSLGLILARDYNSWISTLYLKFKIQSPQGKKKN